MTTSGTTMTPGRGAAITAAVTGPLLLVLSFAQSADGPKVATATPAQIRAWGLAEASAVRVGALGAMLSVVVWLILTAALTRVARDALPRSLLADVFAGAGYLLTVALFLASVADALPVVLPDLIGARLTTVDDDVLRGWYGLTGFTHLIGDFQMAFIALLVGAFSLVVLRTGVAPRWIGWLGMAITVAAALGTAGVTTNTGPLYGFWMGGIFGWALWCPIVGVALGLRSRARRRAAAAPSLPHERLVASESPAVEQGGGVR
ncbi:hypothetical protein ACQP2F_33860 [Actinoplanes sp. CA-030573]|uniref:hypothetical protein n=1 Tax=Actinoplanes sp. CA-030573 TaxID=3239898 RepID=UPI003D8A81AE